METHKTGPAISVAMCCSIAVLAASSGCVATTPAQSTLTGTATYRERIALPPTAAFEATLEDVSRADAPADIIGRVRLESPGQVPIKFAIPYDPARIDATHRYTVRAKITDGDQLLFTTDKHHSVLGAGGAQSVDIVMTKAGARMPPTTKTTATLENTYWKLLQLGTAPVTIADPQREPHLTLLPEQKRVSGYGGCNRMMGMYTVDGDKLTFGQMAGTMMACADGMQTESAFHKALGKVARYRIVAEKLEFFDAAGASLAQFESRMQ